MPSPTITRATLSLIRILEAATNSGSGWCSGAILKDVLYLRVARRAKRLVGRMTPPCKGTRVYLPYTGNPYVGNSLFCGLWIGVVEGLPYVGNSLLRGGVVEGDPVPKGSTLGVRTSVLLSIRSVPGVR
eukprot:m.25320 g.25320  ORF g.25320 m.25320 type:complete len:129 (-) comp7695_c0_seq2:448-834(-)